MLFANGCSAGGASGTGAAAADSDEVADAAGGGGVVASVDFASGAGVDPQAATILTVAATYTL